MKHQQTNMHMSFFEMAKGESTPGRPITILLHLRWFYLPWISVTTNWETKVNMSSMRCYVWHNEAWGNLIGVIDWILSGNFPRNVGWSSWNHGQLFGTPLEKITWFWAPENQWQEVEYVPIEMVPFLGADMLFSCVGISWVDPIVT